jgi:amino acid adenylation domain-containing protein
MTRSSEAFADPACGRDDWIQLLERWNDTRTDFPQVCTHQLFEQQVARASATIAVVYGQRRLSYRDLNERANKVAHWLRRRGVGPDVLVGVCLERSPEMIIALLAVWKAGGAYVPLDPAYPVDRLSFMIEDAQPLVLLTEEKCRQLFSAIGDRAICLDSQWSTFDQEASGDLTPNAGPANLAYVMYTSGSTGKPKGAMITHRGLVNYLWWAIRTYAVETGRSVPVHSSISFDLTVTSLYTPLLAGGTVELLPDDVGAQNLVAALLRVGDRSLVKITPAHLQLLSQQISSDDAGGMSRTFVIGGENLLAETLEFWRAAAPGTRLMNEYGPTETVVGCCVYELRALDPRSGSVPIGRPIANTQLYVLDPALKPLRPGETGELYIGGAGVARGYLNRPELTAERFLPDPFSGVPDSRLYKTGDLARHRADGTLEYLGRTDDQVKVRGYRIELGEIEATLAAHPKVESCAVVAREDDPGHKQLVGYFTTVEGDAPITDNLRKFLKERLPEYMVPARFVLLDSLPLTVNGKVDRKALPAPSIRASGVGNGGTPLTKTAKTVASLWSELLHVDGIGQDDDFFEMGGDSITAVALMTRIRTAFGCDPGLAVLFERPTITGISEVIDMLALTSHGLGLPAESAHREEFVL